MDTYVFSGRVYPERASVTLCGEEEPIKVVVKSNAEGDNDLNGEISIEIICAQITAIFRTENNIRDIYTLKNMVSDAIRLHVDTLGYIMGYGLELEVTSVLLPNGSTIVFGVDIPILFDAHESRLNKFSEIMKLFAAAEGEFLRRCFADLRRAINNPVDTGFFCYRAIESLKLSFCKKECCDEKAGWLKLRNSLKVDRANIDKIKKFADPVRHGDGIRISDKERGELFTITWDIVDRYIDYCIGLTANKLKG